MVAWAGDYATAAELRTYLRIDAVTADATDIAQDTLVHTPSLTAASRMIDKACHRQFGVTTAEARYYTAHWDGIRSKHMVRTDDISSLSSLAVAGDMADDGLYSTTLTVQKTLPLNALASGRVITDLVLDTATVREGAIKVTALYGWPFVPATIKEATLLQASRLVKRRDSPFGVAGDPSLGNELRLLSKLDADVQVMVQPYRRYV